MPKIIFEMPNTVRLGIAVVLYDMGYIDAFFRIRESCTKHLLTLPVVPIPQHLARILCILIEPKFQKHVLPLAILILFPPVSVFLASSLSLMSPPTFGRCRLRRLDNFFKKAFSSEPLILELRYLVCFMSKSLAFPPSHL